MPNSSGGGLSKIYCADQRKNRKEPFLAALSGAGLSPAAPGSSSPHPIADDWDPVSVPRKEPTILTDTGHIPFAAWPKAF